MVRSVRVFSTVALIVGLGACGDGGSAVETRDRAAEGAQSVVSAATGAPANATEPGRTDRASTVLTANRRETVDEKIVRLFERNGADFDARTPADYLDKVRAFTGSPPSGTERVERANGDVLLYQASSNTFAVVSRQGVPKTMFKPTDGPNYWAEQKARAPTFGQRRASQE
ncbi:MAG: S-type pyocin family protein [Caulobacteraceae bacterium]|nr:MAG: S-type pyocin family protein [Caulobacteraceae bacterium]